MMNRADQTIFVIGATGRQGGATARHLLNDGWQVKALTRDTSKPEAQALAQAGAEVVQGDIENQADLLAMMQGVYGVYSVQAAPPDAEFRQGKNVAEAAKMAGVQHFVQSSVQTANDLARVGGDPRKWEIEQYIHALGLPATILRPPFFMDTMFAWRSGNPNANSSNNDTYAIPIKADVPIGLIAAEDIGAFAALAFAQPHDYIGKTLEIAGDVLTPSQVVDTVARVTGRKLTYFQVPMEALRQQNQQIAQATEYLNEVGYSVDLAALRQQLPNLMTLETWLKSN